MYYNNREWEDGETATITGFNQNGAYTHLLIDGVVYMFHNEQVSQGHEFLNEWVCTQWDVLPAMHPCNWDVTVVVRDVENHRMNHCVHVHFMSGDWVTFGMVFGECTCCQLFVGNCWLSE